MSRIKLLNDILELSRQKEIPINKSCELLGKEPGYFRKAINKLKNSKNPEVQVLLRKYKNNISHGWHLVLPDSHCPFHHKRLIDNIVKLMKDIKVVGFHIIGDFIDMYSLSSHEKNYVPIRGLTLAKEYEETNFVLNKICSVLKRNCIKTYVYGNHEDRYYKYIKDVNINKLGSALLPPDIALRLEERGFIVYKNWKEDYISITPGLDLIHGDSVVKYTSEKYANLYQKDVIFGHTHRWQVFKTINTGYNIGWTGDITTEAFHYAPRSKKMFWQLGFCVILVEKDKRHYVYPIQAREDGSFYFGTKLYQ